LETRPSPDGPPRQQFPRLRLPLPQYLTHLFVWRLPGLLIRAVAYLMAGVALMVYLNFSTLQQYFSARERRETYRQSIASLRTEHERLAKEQTELKNNGFDKEKAIRERWLMIKPGEQILFIEPPGEQQQE
jgi:cell division protein FtsB